MQAADEFDWNDKPTQKMWRDTHQTIQQYSPLSSQGYYSCKEIDTQLLSNFHAVDLPPLPALQLL